MRLIPEWRKAPNMFSVQALAVLAFAPAAWAGIPQDLKDAIPTEWLPYIVTGVAIAGLFGRLVDQSNA